MFQVVIRWNDNVRLYLRRESVILVHKSAETRRFQHSSVTDSLHQLPDQNQVARSGLLVGSL